MPEIKLKDLSDVQLLDFLKTVKADPSQDELSQDELSQDQKILLAHNEILIRMFGVLIEVKKESNTVKYLYQPSITSVGGFTPY